MRCAITVGVFLWLSRSLGSTTAAYYQPDRKGRLETTALDATSRRRDVFKTPRSAASAMTGVSWRVGQRPRAATATPASTSDGGDADLPIVQFVVENVDGIEGRAGLVKIQLHPQWAPRGVHRFLELAAAGFWNSCRVFRVLPGFVAQFGIHGSPSEQSKWRSANIPDDPPRGVSNSRGTVVFANTGPNTRTTQIFINTRPEGNAFLDKQGFSPIGKVIQGMDIVDRFYAAYGDGAQEEGPDQALLQSRGNAYLQRNFPKLSFISKCAIL